MTLLQHQYNGYNHAPIPMFTNCLIFSRFWSGQNKLASLKPNL